MIESQLFSSLHAAHLSFSIKCKLIDLKFMYFLEWNAQILKGNFVKLQEQFLVYRNGIQMNPRNDHYRKSTSFKGFEIFDFIQSTVFMSVNLLFNIFVSSANADNNESFYFSSNGVDCIWVDLECLIAYLHKKIFFLICFWCQHVHKDI